MKLIIKKNKNTFFFVSLLLIVYFKYILFVGYSPGDDFFHVNFINDNPSILENIKLNFSISPGRPIGSIILGFAHGIFENNIIIYNLISILLWLFSGLVLKSTFKNLVNKEFSKIFFIIFCFPYLCFSIFIGNTMWSGYILFIFFWSIAFFFQEKFYRTNKINCFIFYFLFLFFSIFTFELIISLLTINALFPFVYKIDKRKLLINFFLILFITLSYFLYKIYILPKIFDVPTYGYSGISLKNVLQSIYFFYAISIENIILLFESLKFSLNFFSLIIFFIIFLLFKNFQIKERFKNNLILLIFFLALVSCSWIFLLSGYPAVTYGHYNKTLVSAYLCFTFILTYFFLYFKINKYFIIFFIFLVINSTFTQIKNFSSASNFKNSLINELSKIIEKNVIDKSDTIIINSPLFIDTNYNNEEIVFTSWDIKFRILNKNNKDINFFLISDRLLKNKNYYPLHNFMNSKFLQKPPSDENKLFYFEYRGSQSYLEELRTKNDIYEKIKSLKANDTNVNVYILREKIRLFMKEIIYKIII